MVAKKEEQEHLGVCLSKEAAEGLVEHIQFALDKGATGIDVLLFRNSKVNVGVEVIENPSDHTIWSTMVFNKGKGLRGKKPHVELVPFSQFCYKSKEHLEEERKLLGKASRVKMIHYWTRVFADGKRKAIKIR